MARTLTIGKFAPEDIGAMRIQNAQLAEVNPASLQSPYGYAWTAWAGDSPIICAGIIEVWEGRAYAWALLSQDAGEYMLAMTREIRSRLSALPFRRVEMAVAAGFSAGCRWAKLLGFECETPSPMRGYLPNGGSAWLYARVSDGNGNDGGHDRSSSSRLDL